MRGPVAPPDSDRLVLVPVHDWNRCPRCHVPFRGSRALHDHQYHVHGVRRIL